MLTYPQILGRVDITRTFAGRELNTEYLFGLFAQLALNPNASTLLGVPMNYTIVHFTANQNIASAATIITFDFVSLGIVLPVEIDTWNVFNAQGQILEYDATFRWFEYLLDTIIATVGAEIGATSTEEIIQFFTVALVTNICETHQAYCNGTNQQYANYSACYDFLTTQVRFGEAYELGMNTILCRSIHENMVPYRPSVHCPHIGPTGGGVSKHQGTDLKLKPCSLSLKRRLSMRHGKRNNHQFSATSIANLQMQGVQLSAWESHVPICSLCRVLVDIIQYCTDDLTYLGVVSEPYFTNQPMVPYGFANSDPTVAAE